MTLIDTNTLLIIVLGLMDPRLIGTHPKSSLFDESDYNLVMEFIGGLENLIILPNIFTEVDNLLNRFTGDLRYNYGIVMKSLSMQIKEEYVESSKGISDSYFLELGLTDALILGLRPFYKTLVTADSKLSDYAISYGIDVLDLKAYKNLKLRNR